MFKEAKGANCRKCKLYKNQLPLYDDVSSCDVMFIGLSAKEATAAQGPLDIITNTGKIINMIEDKCPEASIYKTNLVKCLPLNDKNKIRYPSNKEIDLCIQNLIDEINTLRPKVVFLLGSKVAAAVGPRVGFSFIKWDNFKYFKIKYNDIYYIPVQHPSYIHVYKRNQVDAYVESITEVIKDILD